MSYVVHIMDRAYSSWSLRGWLLFEAFEIPARTVVTPGGGEAFAALKTRIAPSRTVPAVEMDGALVWDSLAIAEELAQRHPEAGLWPTDPAARAGARSLAAEMHAGFPALRAECPMNLRRVYEGYAPFPAVLADAERARELWSWGLDRFGGPFLAGDRISIADVTHLPLASRFVTYGLSMGSEHQAWAARLWSLPAFRRWRAMAMAETRVNEGYELDLPASADWPGIAPRPAQKAPKDARAVNETCPYSGDPVRQDSLAEIDGRIIGFCNPFCRDKSVADAEAWPKLRPLLP